MMIQIYARNGNLPSSWKCRMSSDDLNLPYKRVQMWRGVEDELICLDPREKFVFPPDNPILSSSCNYFTVTSFNEKVEKKQQTIIHAKQASGTSTLASPASLPAPASCVTVLRLVSFVSRLASCASRPHYYSNTLKCENECAWLIPRPSRMKTSHMYIYLYIYEYIRKIYSFILNTYIRVTCIRTYR